MRIDPHTLLFFDLTATERKEMFAYVEDVVLRGNVPPTPDWVTSWLTLARLSASHLFLLGISTVLPQKVLLSLIYAGGAT